MGLSDVNKKILGLYKNGMACRTCSNRLPYLASLRGADGKPAFLHRAKACYPASMHALWGVCHERVSDPAAYTRVVVCPNARWGSEILGDFPHFNVWSAGDNSSLSNREVAVLTDAFHTYFPIVLRMFRTHGEDGIKATLDLLVAALRTITYGDKLMNSAKWLQKHLKDDFRRQSAHQQALTVWTAILDAPLMEGDQSGKALSPYIHQVNKNTLDALAIAAKFDVYGRSDTMTRLRTLIRARLDPSVYMRRSTTASAPSIRAVMEKVSSFSITLMSVAQAVKDFGATFLGLTPPAFPPDELPTEGEDEKKEDARAIADAARKSKAAATNRIALSGMLAAAEAREASSRRRSKGSGFAAAAAAAGKDSTTVDALSSITTLSDLIAFCQAHPITTSVELFVGKRTVIIGDTLHKNWHDSPITVFAVHGDKLKGHLKFPFLWAYHNSDTVHKFFGCSEEWAEVTAILPGGSSFLTPAGRRCHSQYFFALRDACAGFERLHRADTTPILENPLFSSAVKAKYARTMGPTIDAYRRETPLERPAYLGTHAYMMGVGTTLRTDDGKMVAPLRVRVNGRVIEIARG